MPQYADAEDPQPKPFAVVELFTSQGCHSCPPAERLLNTIVHENRDRVFPIAFHVDYWNYLGWKDPYSRKAHSQRQRAYARALRERGVYTPQMIVNGRTGFVGSNRRHARAAIADALDRAPAATLTIDSLAADGREITLDIVADGVSRSHVLVAVLVERGLVTKVARGENAGKTLAHENVARDMDLLTFEPRDGSPTRVVLNAPKNTNLDNASVIVFAQHARTLAIDAAAMRDLE